MLQKLLITKTFFYLICKYEDTLHHCSRNIPAENLNVVAAVGHPGYPKCHVPYSTLVQDL
jgi:hypothetical protein